MSSSRVLAFAAGTAEEAIGRWLAVGSVVAFSAVSLLLPTNDLKATAATLVVVGLALGVFAYARAGGRIEPMPLDVPALTFLLLATLATVFSANFKVSFFPTSIRGEGLPVYAAYVGTALAVARFTPREIRIVLYGVFATGTLMCVLAIGQYYLVPLALWIGGVGLQFGPRGWGTLANPILLGGYLCLVLPVAIAVAVGTRGPRWWALAGVSSVLYAALLASETRAAWIPFAFVVPVLAWLLWGGDRTPRLLILAGLFAAITAVMMPTQPIPLATRALSSFNTGDTSLRQKFYIWTHVIPLIEERPLFGWGFNNLAGRLPGIGTDEYRRVMGSDDVIVDIAHNDVLHIAFSTGLAGLAAYAWVWLLTLQSVARIVWTRALPAADVRFTAGLGCGLLAYLVWAQFGWTHIGPANVFWTFVGITAALASRRAVSTEPVVLWAEPGPA